MDAKLKADWVKALKSGRYRQGRVDFMRGDKYCCLGVLCEVAGEPVSPFGEDNYSFVEEAVGRIASGRLIRMNDIENQTFQEIADYIEANIPSDEPVAS